jgi:hypothetical protein
MKLLQLKLKIFCQYLLLGTCRVPARWCRVSVIGQKKVVSGYHPNSLTRLGGLQDLYMHSLEGCEFPQHWPKVPAVPAGGCWMQYLVPIFVKNGTGTQVQNKQSPTQMYSCQSYDDGENSCLTIED